MKCSKGTVYACSILSKTPLCKASSLHNYRDGVGFSFFFSLFQVSWSVLGLVLIHRGRARNASLEGHGAPPPSDGGEHEAGERTP